MGQRNSGTFDWAMFSMANFSGHSQVMDHWIGGKSVTSCSNGPMVYQRIIPRLMILHFHIELPFKGRVYPYFAMTMPWQCHGNAMAMPWQCHDFPTTMPWSYLDFTIFFSHVQWKFQDPKMEVLYHVRPYFIGVFPYIGLKNRLYRR